MFPPLNKSFTATAESVSCLHAEPKVESNYRCCSYGLGKGLPNCISVPATRAGLSSLRFGSLPPRVCRPWTCAATVGDPRLGRAGVCFPGPIPFQGEGAPSDLSREVALLPGGWGRLGDVTSGRRSLFCLGQAEVLGLGTSALSLGFLTQKIECMPISVLPRAFHKLSVTPSSLRILLEMARQWLRAWSGYWGSPSSGHLLLCCESCGTKAFMFLGLSFPLCKMGMIASSCLMPAWDPGQYFQPVKMSCDCPVVLMS